MDYDIMDDDFVILFTRKTGYALTSCQCGWKRVREELANPRHDIDPASFQYLNTGLPVPVSEGEYIKKTWGLIREKLQTVWVEYVNKNVLT